MPAFVFTDIEGSTRLLREAPAAFADVLDIHRRLIVAAVERHGGRLVHTEGDGGFYAFPDTAGEGAAAAATIASLEAQRALATGEWPEGIEVRVRIGIHVGEAMEVAGDYVGLSVHQAARVSAAGHGGQVLATGAVREATPTLPDGAGWRDLGRHRLKDFDSPESLYQLTHPDLTPEFPPIRTLSIDNHNLPLRRGTFIGRTEEVRIIRKELAQEALVTVVGPGGVGKTRLALEVAAEAIDEQPDGVWLVELAPVASGNVRPAVAAAIAAVGDGPVSETAPPLDNLRNRRLLLVLDNCEHVIDEVATLVGSILGRCPGVRILATSRERLSLPGEVVRRVQTLASPPEGRLDPAVAVTYPAFRLFVDRAERTSRELDLDEATTSAIASICRRLDGLPLALELAAAWLTTSTPVELDAMLARGGDRLAGVVRGVDPRHDGLASLVASSYDSLHEDEQRLLRRLSVIPGSFTMESAEAIAPLNDWWEPKADPALRDSATWVAPALHRLVERSLLEPEASGDTTRYRSLETIRRFAEARLAEAGEEESNAALDAAASWFAFLVWRTSKQWHGVGQPLAAARLAAEEPNIRFAFDHSLSRGWFNVTLRMCNGLTLWWLGSGRAGEGKGWIEEVLRQPGLADDTRARGHGAAGALARAQRDLASARTQYAQALALWEARGDPAGIASALDGLAFVAHEEGDRDRARELLERSLELARGLDRRADIASVLNNLAQFYDDPTRRRALLQEALQIELEHLGPAGRPGVLLNLARTELAAGDVGAAAAAVREAITAARQAGGRLLPEALRIGALVAEADDDLVRAEDELCEALAAAERTDDRAETAEVLVQLGSLARRRRATAVARDHLTRARELADVAQVDAVWAAAAAESALAALAEGDVGAGRALAERAARRAPATETFAVTLVAGALAAALLADGDAPMAATVLGSAAVVGSAPATAIPLPPWRQREWATWWQQASDAAPDAVEERAAAGAAMGIAAALRAVLVG